MSLIVAAPSPTSGAASSTYATWYPTGSAYPQLPDLPCTVGAFYCPSSREWAQCAYDNGNDVNGGTRYIFMGNTAAGTTCYLPADLSDLVGHIGSDNAGYCAEEGAIVCGQSGYTWYRCDHGGLISMGQVAAGTACQDGALIVPYDGPNGPANGDGNAPYTPPAAAGPTAGPSPSYIYGQVNGYDAATSSGGGGGGGGGSGAATTASNTDPPVKPTGGAEASSAGGKRRERKR